MKLRFHFEAEQELSEAHDWYTARSEVAAQAFALEVDHAISLMRVANRSATESGIAFAKRTRMDEQQERDEPQVHQLQPQRDPDETWSVPLDDLDATWPVAHKPEQRAD